MDRLQRILIVREAITKIAKILTADKVAVTQSGVQAFVRYDEKTMKPTRVNIPMIPDDASDELIDAIQGFLDGEISRVLYADSKSALRSKYEKMGPIYNPIEGLFCEKKMIDTYAGSRNNLNKMHQEFVDRFVEPKLAEALAAGADEGQIFQVLAVPALRAWGGIKFFQDYMVDKWSLIAGIQTQLDPIASKMAGMKDASECYDMAKQIRNVVMGEPPEGDGDNPFGDKKGSGGGKGGGGGGRGSGGKAGGSGGKANGGAGGGALPEEEKEEEEEEGAGDGEEADEEEDLEEIEDEEEDEDGDDAEEKERKQEEAGNGGDGIAEQNENKGPDEDTESTQEEYGGANYMANFDWNKIQDINDQFGQYVTDLCSEETDKEAYSIFTREWDQLEPPEIPRGYTPKWLEDMEAKIQGMVGPVSRNLERAFAARNKSLNQQGQRKGKMSAGNLYRLTTDDDRIFKKLIEHKTRDIAVALVVDCSGSMSGSKIQTAMLSAWVMADVLTRLGVACEVTGFTTGDVSSVRARELYSEMQAENAKGRSWNRVEPLRLPMFKSFNEKFGIEQKKRMASFPHIQGIMACNVDGESVQYAYESLCRHAHKGKRKGKMMIVFSDGQPAGGGCYGSTLNNHLKAVVKRIEESGTNIVGVGIQSNTVQQFYRKNVKIDNIEELPGIVLNQLRDALLAS